VGAATELGSEDMVKDCVQHEPALDEQDSDAPASDDGTTQRLTDLHLAADELQLEKAAEILASDPSAVHARDSGGRTPLHAAATCKLPAMVQLCLDAGADVNAVDSTGATALLLVSSDGNRDAVSMLLKAGAKVDVADNRDFTPLHAAFSDDYPEVVQQLLEAGADVHAADSTGATPLHHASGRGCNQSAPLLLKASAKVEAVDKEGCTPLHYASEMGHTDMVELLVIADASVTALTNTGSTPLQLAIAGSHAEIVQLLLEALSWPYSLDAEASSSGQPQATTPLQEAAVGVVDEEGYTPLHFAALWSHTAAAQLLLDAGASVNATTTNSSSTPLHLAVQAGDDSMVSLLLDRGAQPDSIDNNGCIPLHLASSSNQLRAVEALLQHSSSSSSSRALVNAADQDGQTPLHLAADKGHRQVAACLIEAGADVNARATGQITPLHRAVIKGHWAVVQLLLDAGADPAAADGGGANGLQLAVFSGHTAILEQLLAALTVTQRMGCLNQECRGKTPVHWAVGLDRMDCLKALLAAGADADRLFGAAAVTKTKQSLAGASALHRAVQLGRTEAVKLLATPANMRHLWQGSTPLHMAAKRGDTHVASCLIEAGANVDARAADQSTPLHEAIVNEHEALVQLLLDAGADPGAAANNGETGLQMAVNAGKTVILEQLLAAMKASQRMGCLNQEWDGMTPLAWAVEDDHTDCVKALLAAGADADKIYGEAAPNDDSESLAGASALHRAVQLGRTAAAKLLATPGNMRHLWKGSTPLHMALAGDKPCLAMAQLLVEAGSPAALEDADGHTAIWLAYSTSEGRALLPGMVRNECQLCKALQQQTQDKGGQQQQQQQPLDVLAGLVKGMYSILEKISAHGLEGTPGSTQLALDCVKVVVEVLGPAAASSLLQQVLADDTELDEAPESSGMPCVLFRVLHSGWVKAVWPLMQQRWRVTNRLQQLVLPPLQPQQQGGAYLQQVLASGQLPASAGPDLQDQARAAAAAGDWQQWVHVLEQLTGLHTDGSELSEVEEERGPDQHAYMAGPCDALLGAWVAAQQQVAGRVWREAADVVVQAVEAAAMQRRAARMAGST
jgi:ankyrin repeat protein